MTAGLIALIVLAIFVAFQLNYRAGRAVEEVAVSRTALVVRKIAPGGAVTEKRFNPRWARLEVERDADEGVTRLAVRVRDERVRIGAFLNPADRTSFAQAFGDALVEARR